MEKKMNEKLTRTNQNYQKCIYIDKRSESVYAFSMP